MDFTIGGEDKKAQRPIQQRQMWILLANLPVLRLVSHRAKNTTVTVSDGTSTYTNGDVIPEGTELTITVVAAENYELSTFTIDTVDATSPATHIAAAEIAIVTAATEV